MWRLPKPLELHFLSYLLASSHVGQASWTFARAADISVVRNLVAVYAQKHWWTGFRH